MENSNLVETNEPKVDKTHTGWTYWYHNPIDKCWDLKSYTKIYDFHNLQDYLKINKSWDSCLPPVSEGMFFLMRKFGEGDYINPLWEDKYNRNGGFWSFKVNKEEAIDIWNSLSDYLVCEKISKYLRDNMMINGISISPKRNFCIIKIWNNDIKKCDKALLCSEIPNLAYSECMYKCHNDNIANDSNKTKTYNHKNNYNQKHGNNQFTTNAFMKKRGPKH